MEKNSKKPAARMGRPPKDPADRLRGAGGLTVPLTAGQRAAIDAAAGEQPVTVWAREVLLRAARRAAK